ncbi:MAG: hypothetical protein KKE42_10780 [Alphaproteobacteria bacterium]|uniref:hypothetical protein n=1 Tax=Brevundimonas sp. TaxID=1871086 RepID=UPI001DD94CC1|nr:hypothetical protein [Brevundimonas sp.]MBU3969445.1 hypothetical protein [Alphaproteobacteria bacterium]MBU3974267.1 hypothetical protein [Alphaproteobacteria bacterium]MBU4038684.1 hypothetical protein [Alphaproteobacteria bacterium]MBU4138289.1 hypothetical protein [Alphaproteobacteria bacterium]
MKTLTSLLAGATVMALSPGVAIADGSDMSFAVHDILVTSNIPAINISVRNLSPSPFPAMRNLRVTSPTPVLNVAGQVWCKSFQNAHTRADEAQVMFGNASVISAPNGADVLTVGTWSASPVAQLGANETLRNYSIAAPVNFPDHWNGGFALGFNPVREVEERMQQFVQNGAGTEADFLRTDDVFETTITMNAVGWCEYDSQNLSNKRYAGLRQIEVPVHIFYHGDEDIEDQVTSVGSRGTIQAPPPGRRGRDAAPPPRRAPSSRQGGTRRPDREREPAEAHGDVYIAIPDIDGEDSEGLIVPAVQRQQDEPEADRRTDDRDRSGIGDTIRREAARAAIGALLGSGRSSRGSSPRPQPGRPRGR